MLSFRTPRIIAALVVREVEAGQKSPLSGLIWAVLEPVCGIALLTLLFMIALPSPPLGTSFSLFYATGLLPLALFQDVTQRAQVALRFSRPLLGFSQLGLINLIAGRIGFALLIQLTSLGLIMLGLFTTLGPPPNVNPPQIVVALLAMAWLAIGFSFFGGWLSGIIPSWPRIWGVFLRPLILISGVFFLIDDVGDPYRDWLLFNPVAHPIVLFREGIFVDYASGLGSGAFVFGAGLCFFLAGVVGLRLTERQMLDGLT